MSIEKLDHEQVAISRLLTQFSEAENLKGYIKALLSEANTLEQVFCDIIDLRTIDTATGFTLDVIGVLVGQPRILVDANLLMFFGYQGVGNEDSYGTLSDSSIGARYLSLGEDTTGNVELTDEEYRLFIRARIAKNHSNGSINDVASLTSFLSGADLVIVQDGLEPASFTLGIGKKLSANEKQLLKTNDLIPKPAGVNLNLYFDFPAENAFGYAGAFSGVKGYDVGEYAESF